MSLLKYAKMPFSFHEGWDQIGTAPPSVLKTFFLLVLPFSLLPPAMLLYAGGHHAQAYRLDADLARWFELAQVFFAAELLTVPLMGFVIKQVASTRKIATDFRHTYRLAAITAVPMWLSSLGLAIPRMWPMIVVILLGLGIAASVLYHGCCYVLKMRDPMDAQLLSCEAFAFGAMVWALLCGFVLINLMG
ncbi:MAG: Yip1 family protein [Bacillota bacterium]